LERLPFDAQAKTWDQFAGASYDAWFWHTSDWMDYTQEYSGEQFIANRSFYIVENGKELAICPLFVEWSQLSDGAKQFSCAGSLNVPIAFPAMVNGLPRAKRDDVIGYYVQVLESIAHEEGVGHVSVRVPTIARSYIEHGRPFANPLLAHGFTDLAHVTRVIDLEQPESALWSDIRKGHRSDIRKAEKFCQIRVWDRSNITLKKFREYQELHRKDMGRVTRSQRTFDLMLSWIRCGNAILTEAEHEGIGIGFSLFNTFGHGAFYGSTCKDPEYMSVPVSHLIQWSTICWLKTHGYRWYETGPQTFGPQFHHPATDKSASISSFNRGFGGQNIPSVTAEYFYSKELMEKVYRKRMDNLFALISAAPAKA